VPSTDATIGDLAGRVIGAETWTPGAEMIRGDLPAEKTLTLGQYARLWESGQDPGGAASLGGPSDPFRQSLWVYRCITVIATNAARVPIRLSRAEAAGTKGLWGAKHVRLGRHPGRKIRRGEKANLKAREGEIVEGGELYELLARPNPHQTWYQLMLQTAGLLFSDGRVHWLFDEMRGRVPLSIYAISGKQTRPVYEKGRRVPVLTGWKFTEPGGKSYGVSLDELITWQLFNPEDPHAGLAPKVPANLAIVSDYNASLYNAAMFGNSAEPGGLLRTDAPFNADQDEQLRTAWNQRHRGAAKAKALAIAWGGLQWQSVASSMHDMQYGEGKRLTRTETCAGYGVPEVVAGFYTDANYQFAESGRMQFWQETEMPLLDQIGEGVTVHLCSRFPGGLEAWFDVEDVPIVQKMRLANLDAVDKLWPKGAPLADLNKLYDLGLPERAWHETGFLPTSLMPAAEVAAGNVFGPPANEGPSNPASDELDQAEQTGNREQAAGSRQRATGSGEPATGFRLPASDAALKAAADRIWADWARSWQPLARTIQSFLRRRYFAQERKIGKLLAELPEGAMLLQAEACHKDDSIVARILFEVFGDADDRNRFRARVRTFTADANELGIRQALVEGGFAGEDLEAAARQLLSSPRIAAAIRSDAVRVSSLIDNFTRRVLKDQLEAGMAAGDGIRQLTDRVQSVMGNRREAAMTVARNSVGQALSASRHAGHLHAGLTHKAWIHSRGPGERREAHVAAEARYAAEPIPIGQPFVINGAALMFPRDHSAGRPEETINCQCLQIAKRLPRGSRARLEDFIYPSMAEGFVSYRDMLAARQQATGNREQESSND